MTTINYGTIAIILILIISGIALYMLRISDFFAMIALAAGIFLAVIYGIMSMKKNQ